jgi:hypothetical protein
MLWMSFLFGCINNLRDLLSPQSETEMSVDVIFEE